MDDDDDQRQCKKPRHPACHRWVWIAVRPPPGDFPAPPPREGRDTEQFLIVGCCQFIGANSIEQPSKDEWTMMANLQWPKESRMEQWVLPVSAYAAKSEWLAEPVAVKLPCSRNKISAHVPAEYHANPGLRILPESYKWIVFKCDKLHPCIAKKMMRHQAVSWPMFPRVASALQISMPAKAEQPGFEPHAPPCDEEEQSENDDDSSDEPPDTEARGRDLYDAERKLHFMKFCSFLKSTKNLREVLVSAAHLLDCDPERIKDPSQFDIPFHATIRNWRIKLDMSMMLFSRFRWNTGRVAAQSLMCDASELSHVDYFCQQAHVLSVPARLGAQERMHMDAQECFESEILPLAVVGHGEKDVAHKARVVMHVAKLLTGTPHALLRWRNSIVGLCTDQGSERALADMPNCDEPSQLAEIIDDLQHSGNEIMRNPKTYFFPRALWVSGPMHIIWNGCEAAIKASPGWDQFKDVLGAIAGFLGHRGLRLRYVETCLQEELPAVRKQFKSWRRAYLIPH